MKRKLTVIGIIATLLLTLLLTSCGGGIKIAYELNGGTLEGAPASFENGEVPDFSKIVPAKEGYQFAGWYMDANFKTKLNVSADAEGTVTLYAKWAKEYTISYELDGATASGMPETYIAGEEIEIQDYTAEKTGFVFFGWYLDAEFDERASIDEDTEGNLTLYPKFLPAPSLKSSIPDKSKYYLGEGSAFTVNLSKYFDQKSFNVEFVAESDNSAAVTVSVDGSILTVTLLNSSAEANITVGALVDGTEYASDTFKAKASTAATIACIGDSITRAAAFDEEPEYKYPSLIQDKLGADFTVHNFGVSGSAVTPYGKYPEKVYNQTEEYTASLASNAEIIVIMLGTNDSKAWEYSPTVFNENLFKTRYSELIASYKQACPNAEIYLVSVIPVGTENSLSFDPTCIAKILDAQFELAEELDLPILNAFEIFDSKDPFNNEGYYLEDQIHLDQKGLRLLADSVFEFILKN